MGLTAVDKWVFQEQRSRREQGLDPYTKEELYPIINRLERVEEVHQLQRVRKQLGQQPLTEEDLEPVGFLEAMGERGVSGYIPFVGGGVEALDLVDVYLMAERVKDGTGTEDDEHELMDWWLDQQLRATRGTSWGGTVGEIASQLPAFAGEFVLTGGVHCWPQGGRQGCTETDLIRCRIHCEEAVHPTVCKAGVEKDCRRNRWRRSRCCVSGNDRRFSDKSVGW